MSIFFFQNRVERLYLSWIGKPIPADIAGMCRYPPICADMCRYVPISAGICRYLADICRHSPVHSAGGGGLLNPVNLGVAIR